MGGLTEADESLGRLRRRLIGGGAALAAVLSMAGASGCTRAAAHDGGTGYSLETVIPCDARGGCLRFQRRGWAAPETSYTWTSKMTVKLKLSLAPVKGPLGLRMRLMGNLDPPELPVQVVEVSANGQKIATWLVDAADDFLAVIPAHALRADGKLHIDLHIPRAQRLPASPPDEARVFGVACYEFEVSKAGSLPGP